VRTVATQALRVSGARPPAVWYTKQTHWRTASSSVLTGFLQRRPHWPASP